VPVPQNARAAPKGVAKGSDVESIRSRAIRGELPSLSHLLELAHAVGSQAERTAAESERNRKTDEAAVRTLIESGLLKVLQPARFGGYELGLPGFVRICQTLARYDVHFRGFTPLSAFIIGGAPSSVTLEALEQMVHRYADEVMDIAREQRTIDRAMRGKAVCAYIACRARSSATWSISPEHGLFSTTISSIGSGVMSM